MKQHYHTWYQGICLNCGANQRTVLAEQKAKGLDAQRAKRARKRSLRTANASEADDTWTINPLIHTGGAK